LQSLFPAVHPAWFSLNKRIFPLSNCSEEKVCCTTSHEIFVEFLFYEKHKQGENDKKRACFDMSFSRFRHFDGIPTKRSSIFRKRYELNRITKAQNTIFKKYQRNSGRIAYQVTVEDWINRWREKNWRKVRLEVIWLS